MDNEEAIANRLKQNLPQEPQSTPEPKPVETLPVGQADVAPSLELDELTVFKLHDMFGEDYRATDETRVQQAKYIYAKVSELTGENDYGLIVGKIRELERIAGFANSERRMFKLYQWLKLDSIRRSAESQMNSLREYTNG